MAESPTKERNALREIADIPIWQEPKSPQAKPVPTLARDLNTKAMAQAAEYDLVRQLKKERQPAPKAKTLTPPAAPTVAPTPAPVVTPALTPAPAPPATPSATPAATPHVEKPKEAFRREHSHIADRAFARAFPWAHSKLHGATPEREPPKPEPQTRGGNLRTEAVRAVTGSRRNRVHRGETEATPVTGPELHRDLAQQRAHELEHGRGPRFEVPLAKPLSRGLGTATTAAYRSLRTEETRSHSLQPEPRRDHDNRPSSSWSHIPATSPYRDPEVSQPDPFPQRDYMGRPVRREFLNGHELSILDPNHSQNPGHCPGECHDLNLERGSMGHCPRR